MSLFPNKCPSESKCFMTMQSLLIYNLRAVQKIPGLYIIEQNLRPNAVQSITPVRAYLLSRLNNAVDADAVAVNCLKLAFDKDLQLALYRHWDARVSGSQRTGLVHQVVSRRILVRFSLLATCETNKCVRTTGTTKALKASYDEIPTFISSIPSSNAFYLSN